MTTEQIMGAAIVVLAISLVVMLLDKMRMQRTQKGLINEVLDERLRYYLPSVAHFTESESHDGATPKPHQTR